MNLVNAVNSPARTTRTSGTHLCSQVSSNYVGEVYNTCPKSYLLHFLAKCGLLGRLVQARIDVLPDPAEDLTSDPLQST